MKYRNISCVCRQGHRHDSIKEAHYCYLLTIYSKTEKTDVIPEEIEALLQSLEQEFFSDDSEAGEPDDAEASETLSKKR